MDSAKAYGTLVIPATLTRTTLQAAGLTAPPGRGPPRPALTFLQNSRLGSLGVGLAGGVLTPATAQISAQVAKKLHSNAGADLITLTPVAYRPLPDHSALGLSAFYIALLAIIGRLPGGDADQLIGRRGARATRRPRSVPVGDSAGRSRSTASRRC